MNIKNIFSRKPIELNIPTLDEHDSEKLEHSFNLLRRTTFAVTEAAADTARFLEERLRDTEYRFFSTIDSIDDFIIIKDGAGKWKTVNKAGQNLFKWIHGEYYDKTDKELLWEYPLYTETLNKCSDSDERAWRSKKSYRSQECVPYGTEGYRCFDVLKTPVFDEIGKRKELIIVGRDITEDLEKQRRMKAAFIALNSVSDIIVILDYRGNIFFCNDTFLITFNENSYEEVVGKHICDIITIDEFENMWNVISHNGKWDGTCTSDSFYNSEHDLHVTPMMNGVTYPIYYICTLRPKLHV